MSLKDKEYKNGKDAVYDLNTGIFYDKFYNEKDVKEAVLEFKSWINKYNYNDETYEVTGEEVLDEFIKIFGEWEK